MAKKKKGAIISFEVTDDGTLKQLGRKAESAGKSLDGVGKSAGDTRRNLQSMSGRTESASKSFSRLQQGTGGLVQSYAILASTVFAVTAAFRALENAQNIQQQIKGFKELTKITGTSMLTITNQVRAAADGLLDFQTAAQQTAIATAAGFDSSQIVGLTEGAKNASVALGRDLTDSFNRLIRGVTKAEPELLDELGVILRLDIATRNYAASIGASADKLTIAQRRTAVYNEVQKQLNDNFGAIAPKANDLTNNISKFTTKLGDIGIAVSGFLLPAVNAFVNFLTNNLPILIGLLTIFGIRLLNDVVPGITKVGSATAQWVTNSEKQITALNKKLDQNAKKYKQLGNKNMSVEKKVSVAFKKSLKKRGMDEKVFFEKSAANQKRSITAHINSLKKQEKATGRSMQRQIAIQKAAYAKIAAQAQVTGRKIGIGIDQGAIMAEKGLLRLRLTGQKVFASLTAQVMKFGFVFRGLGVLMNFAMGAFMAFSLATMFLDMIPAVRRAKEAAEELRQEFKVSRERTEELVSSVNSFKTTKLQAVNDAIRDIKEDAIDAFDTFVAMDKALEHLANTFKNSPMENAEQDILKQVETSLAEAGLTNFMGLNDTDAADEAGKIYGSKFIDGVIQGILADEEKTKGLVEGFFGDIGEDKGFNTKQKRHQRNLGEERGTDIFNQIKNLSTFDGTDNERKQLLKNLMEDLEKFGMTAKKIFEVVEKDGVKSVNMLTGASQLLVDLGEVPADLKLAAQSISDMDEPMSNFIEQMNLAIPKPSELQKRGAALGQIFTQMNAAMEKGSVELAMQKMLSKEAQEKLKKIDQDITMKDIIIFKLTTTLGIEKKIAELMVDKNDVITEHFEALEAMINIQKAIGMVEKQELKLLNQLKDSHTKIVALEIQKEYLQDRILVNQAKEADMALQFKGIKDNEKVMNDQKLMDLQAQTSEMETQLAIIENQLDKFFQLRKTMVESFDSAGQSALTSIIDGGSGTDAIRGMAEKMKKDISGFVAGGIMEKATGGLKSLLQMDKEETVKLTPEAKAIKEVHDEHVDRLQLALEAHASAFGKVYKDPIQERIDYNNLTDNDTLFNDDYGVQNKTGDEQGGFLSKIFGKKDEDGEGGGLISGYIDRVKTSFGEIFGENGAFMQTGKNLFGGEDSVFGKLGKSLFGEGGAFSKLFSGEKGGIMGGLGKMFGGGAKAGGGFLSSIFGGGAGGGGIMGLLKPLLSMIPGIGPLLSILPFAKGGIIGNKLVGLAQGGVMPRYAKGGVATQPTYLVGEGKQNEAVVPLPDNRSIPVDLGRGAGNENNVSINVNMATGKTDTKADAQEGKQLGAAINAAVLNEIEKQQRPGGMLAQG